MDEGEGLSGGGRDALVEDGIREGEESDVRV